MAHTYSAILLDLDGTLVNTLYSLQDTMNKTMEILGLDPISMEQTKKYVGNGGQKFVERALAATADRYYREAEKWEEKDEDRAFDLDQKADEVMELYDEAWTTYIRLFHENCTYRAEPYPGMKDCLDRLKAEGWKVACITNKSLQEAVKVLNTAFGEGYFDYISADDGTHPLKPDTAVVWDVLSHIGKTKEECLYVGDTNTDMETAARAGIPSIGCMYGFRGKKELEDSGAVICIEKAADLLQAVEYLTAQADAD